MKLRSLHPRIRAAHFGRIASSLAAFVWLATSPTSVNARASAQTPAAAATSLPMPTVDLSQETAEVLHVQYQSTQGIEFRLPPGDTNSAIDIAMGDVNPVRFQDERCRLNVDDGLARLQLTQDAVRADIRCTQLLTLGAGKELLVRVGNTQRTVSLIEGNLPDFPLYTKTENNDQTTIEFKPLPTSVAENTHYWFDDDGDGRFERSAEPLVRNTTTGRINATNSLQEHLLRHVLHGAHLTVLVHINDETRPGKTVLRRLPIKKEDRSDDDNDDGNNGNGNDEFDFERQCLCELHRLQGLSDESPISACNTATKAGTNDPPNAYNETKRRQRRLDRLSDKAAEDQQANNEEGSATQRKRKLVRRWTQRDRKRARDLAVTKEWQYLVCVDATNLEQPPTLRVYPTRTGADPDARAGGRHLFAGRDVEMRTWRPKGVTVEAELGGTVGPRDLIADAPNLSAQADKTEETPEVDPTPVHTFFVGRSGDENHVELKVEFKKKKKADDETLTVVREFIHTFSIHEVYIGSFRVAAGASWAPWDRTWTTRQRNTTLNPGHEIIVNDGQGSGIAHIELIAGFTKFWFPVYAGERTVSAGSFVGLGVVSTAPEKGIAAFTSVHVSPVELTIGRYFGIGFDVSLRRTERLRSGLSVGSPVPDATNLTRFGVTPAFGLVFNLGPRFAKTVGLARKGFTP